MYISHVILICIAQNELLSRGNGVVPNAICLTELHSIFETLKLHILLIIKLSKAFELRCAVWVRSTQTKSPSVLLLFLK
jgi:hypothetical protein